MPKPTRVRAKTKKGGPWFDVALPKSWRYDHAKIGYAGYGIKHPTAKKKAKKGKK